MESLLEGLETNPREESSIPFDRWNSHFVRERYGAWGPPPRHYLPAREIEGKGAEWKRERVIAVGLRYLGYPYQHYHIPDWLPPGDWPWKRVEEGRNTKGVDCSNFSSFVYNQALGLLISSDISIQSRSLEAKIGGGEGVVEIKRIERPATYEDFKRELKTGDLLYINSKGIVTHVIIWVGKIGVSPDGTPLILDSTGSHHKDCTGEAIPNGVHLRPFSEDSWYFRGMDHALRLIE